MQRKPFYSLVLASSLSVSSLIAPTLFASAEEAPAAQTITAPPIMITELLPNSNNVSGSDAYEFIELYNNSSQPFSLKDYKLVYGYPDGKTADWVFKEDKTIDPGETMVVWIKLKNKTNESLTLADFNTEFGTSLTESQFTYIESDGMANGSERSLSVADTVGNVLSKATYLPGDVSENKGIQYKPNTDGKTMDILNSSEPATPGTLIEEQKPEAPAELDTKAPVITHTPLESIEAGSDVTIRASASDETKINNVKVFYQLTAGGAWLEKEMTAGEDGSYEAVIGASELLLDGVTYRIEAFDGQNTAKTEDFLVAVSGLDYDPQAVPALLVTELVPDSTNVGSSDGYEFIEVYNNTDKEINLKDYTLRYRYPAEGSEADLVWKAEKEDIVLPAGESITYWIINAANRDKTVADFNSNYGTDLQENIDIVKVYSGGMANDSSRGVAIATNTGVDVSAAYYFDQPNVDDSAANKGVFYAFPSQADSKDMRKYSAAAKNATPGAVDAVQVPAVKKKTTVDEQAPVVTDMTETAPVSARQNVKLAFDASDDQSVKTMRLYYKTKEVDEYTAVDLVENYDTGLYSHTVYSPELFGKEGVQYFVKASDGTNDTETEVKDILVLNDTTEKTGLNVEDGSILSKIATIKSFGQDSTLSIDEQDVTNETVPSLPTNAYFAFDVKKANLYFKNGVTIGEETLHIFDDTINTYETMTVPVDPSKFKMGEGTTMSIRAGTKVSPFDTNSEENRDDFYVKNVRLVLEDGTTIYDPSYNDAAKEISIGDGGSAKPVVDFTFNLPDEAFTAKAYQWDTTKKADGKYSIKAGGSASVIAEVQVDNSAPVITPSVQEGELYKGEFTINAEVEDDSDVETLTARLDGEEVSLPLDTSSAKLSPGAHTVEFTAIDQAGNEAKQTVTFTVVEEQPYAPEAASPADGETNVNPNNAKLQVNVTDPTNDTLDVDFYRGYEYAPNDAEVRVFENNAEQEPPKEMVPAGETAVSNTEKMAQSDGEYVETKSLDKFPYHRFEVAVDEKVDETDEIALHWEGKSLIGRKVSMYVWNYAASKWELEEWKVAQDDKNFTLAGQVKGLDYVKDGKVQVMVQDEIASTPEFDYSFIWMSDTQYYSESYPHIFDRMTKWLAEQKEALNLKYVFHTGDLVDEADQPVQWERADAYMKTLDDAQIPYGVLAGNHDVGHKTGDYNEYSKYFGEARFAQKDYYGESYKDNRGHYDLISSNGNDFIMLYMGWGVNEEDIAWMNKVLAEHPDRKAVISLHEYLLVSGNRSPIGDQVFEDVVKQNENVIAVLSGHYHDSETLIDEIDDDGDGTADRKVYQMLADYQGGPEGGQGFLRLMKVNPVENKMYLQTYSPYLDQYNYYSPVDYPGKDEFAIDVDLTPKEKVVATDSFKAEVYTDEKIGSQTGIKDGKTAEATWRNIERSTEHGWYVKVKDSFGGDVQSDVWSFTTGSQGSGNGDGGSTPTPTPSPVTPPVGDGPIIDVTDAMIEKGGEAWRLTSDQKSIEWVLPKMLIDAAAQSAKPLQVQTAEGHSALIPSEVLAQMRKSGEKKVSIQMNVVDKKDASLPSGQVYSSILDITIKAGETDIASLDAPVELRFKVEGNIKEDKTTGAFYNEATKRWEYAGGYEENGYWVIPVSHLSIFTVMSVNAAFADAKDHWAKNEIESLASRLITSGKTESTFAPEQKLTRAEFAVLLVRALQIPLHEYEGTFADVLQSKEWAARQIEAANRAGIVFGKEDAQFDPDADITREQMAAMMIRALQFKNPELLDGLQSTKIFKDEKRINAYAKKAVAQAAELELIYGRSNGKFDPKKQTTRAETAVMLYRLMNKMK
ncbi:S-layer homology domain-containing protein [Domibacillus sp. A3M-37]|uniref:S-layer homology domain-containing protein n=1 Tax=Domibacillus sp. A3M-37 TaxID=2962037 RepID=UPI0020B7E7C2|nr:S-layer homology domain-containing protein [Domibacillus sp. A3M-37]MCP3761285.1 S-layer homology domain-containing protein [Domibacillus sp. A3M-37]